MNVGVKIGAGLVDAVVVFVAGYRYAAALYGKDIAALREDYAARAAGVSCSGKNLDGFASSCVGRKGRCVRRR